MPAPEKLDFTATLMGYTATRIALSMVGRIFGFYYVRIFLDLYHIDSTWFQWAQVLYMVWNTVNDPLFAYIQDNANWRFVKTRRHSLLYGGPVYAIVFLVPWFPWEEMGVGSWKTGVHLIVALCLYDTMMTFLGLAQCCLFSEISGHHEDKVRLLRWSKLGPVFGAIVLYLTEYLSDGLKVFRNFQISCVVLAWLALVLNWYAGKHCVTQYDVDRANSRSQGQELHPRSSLSIWRLTWQIMTSKNFICFVTINFCHEFHRIFLANFMAIMIDNLTKEDDISIGVRSFCYGVGGLIPSALVILGSVVIKSVGSYRLIAVSFYLKIAVGAALFWVGMGRPWLLLGFMMADSGISSAAFALFDMPLSDIAEEDKEKYNRRSPITSMVFGTNALVVKPVYSLSPMFIVAVLDLYGYSKMRKDKASLSGPELDNLHSTMFLLICLLPVVVGIIQSIVWSRYTLRHAHRKQQTDKGGASTKV